VAEPFGKPTPVAGVGKLQGRQRDGRGPLDAEPFPEAVGTLKPKHLREDRPGHKLCLGPKAPNSVVLQLQPPAGLARGLGHCGEKLPDVGRLPAGLGEDGRNCQREPGAGLVLLGRPVSGDEGGRRQPVYGGHQVGWADLGRPGEPLPFEDLALSRLGRRSRNCASFAPDLDQDLPPVRSREAGRRNRGVDHVPVPGRVRGLPGTVGDGGSGQKGRSQGDRFRAFDTDPHQAAGGRPKDDGHARPRAKDRLQVGSQKDRVHPVGAAQGLTRPVRNREPPPPAVFPGRRQARAEFNGHSASPPPFRQR